jgi:predicted aspartyl protease
VRFDYAEREVDPQPGEFGIQIIHEPIIVVRFIGPAQTYLIRGLLDTGASMTLLPRYYFHKLGMSVASTERVRLRTVSGYVDVLLGLIDLELRLQRTKIRWSAQVGFVPRSDNLALLGHAGFLDHFTAKFDGLRKRVTVKPNETLPAPVSGPE